jgi:hypothetical protein
VVEGLGDTASIDLRVDADVSTWPMDRAQM